MTGLDFEELDKAIQSAMGSNEDQPDAEVKNLEFEPVKNPNERPQIAKPNAGKVLHDVLPTKSLEGSSNVALIEVVDDSGDTERQSADRLVKNTAGGKFMDFRPKKTETKSTMLSGHGNAVIEPANVGDQEESGLVDELHELDHLDPKISSVEDEEWPDPVDDDSEDLNFEETSVDSPTPDTTAQPSDKPDEEKKPVLSPFIANPQVEKRPLGRPETSPPKDEPAVGQTKSESDEPDDKKDISFDDVSFDVKAAADAEPQSDKAANLAPMPSELQDDLLRIEAEGFLANAKPAENSEQTEDFSKAIFEKPAAAVVEVPSKTIVSLPPRPEAKAAATSANNDVHEQIYSTAAYPHAVTVKHKWYNGWLIPVLIFAMLVLGAIGGVAVYLMTT